MTNQTIEKPPSIPSRPSGIKTVLAYTGIPPSWLDKRPKLPSRNWLIFLSVTSSVVGLYIYDRRECKNIRQSYIDRVKHLAEVPIDPFEAPRRVTVYGAKWPADEDYDQSIKYFRKYVKPILVAAAVDYEMIPGKRHGDIAKRVAEDVRIRRRLAVGLDQDHEAKKILPTYKPLAEREKRDLEGGVIIIGRPTLKEYMAGLRKGWMRGLEKIDADEELSRVLENDTYFDEPDEPEDFGEDASPDSRQAPLSPQSSPPTFRLPPLPPLLLVPFTNYIGISQIPLMIWGFFNQRNKVRAGAESAYRLVMSNTRPIEVPETLTDTVSPTDDTSGEAHAPAQGDLDFNKEVEGYYKKSLDKFPEDVEKIRQKYYEALPAKLATARELARGSREPTKQELENPPPTEVELRAERLKKERRWRDDVEGWDIIKPSSNVAWDERFRSALRVFVDHEDESDAGPSETS
ncbi:inner membrane protein import complex subunit Tim54-domain-containing protein [Flammula alnicola]|nr:inner membrane protein import complex subunit Tim54-domain-containing protein [Flammula alnicola]